jgi:hypothetical protein
MRQNEMKRKKIGKGEGISPMLALTRMSRTPVKLKHEMKIINPEKLVVTGKLQTSLWEERSH